MAEVDGVSPMARAGAALLLVAPWFALANLVAGRTVVSERLVLGRGAVPRVAADLLALVRDGEAYARARAALVEVRTRLERPEVAVRAARALLAVTPAARA
ncbi:MAG: hypothetical protein ACKOSS_12595 [Planctomycetia bacterium]